MRKWELLNVLYKMMQAYLHAGVKLLQKQASVVKIRENSPMCPTGPAKSSKTGTRGQTERLGDRAGKWTSRASPEWRGTFPILLESGSHVGSSRQLEGDFVRRCVAWVCAIAVGATLASGVKGQTAATQATAAPSQQDLLDRIKALQEQVDQLKAQVSQIQPTTRPATQPTSAAPLRGRSSLSNFA
jgi:uncharacterized protein HemX